ncbi:efflux transporter outer membrane subunit [Phenylobacterium montanum]|uniref:TolC family protein n=1 Tax=Phenylobacterium montanum TaxID=2823693 RepID=A0A975G4M1_9CAUL|nr:TolC family protein [Caulobacter sp. S6]QUD90488.1 TolC family protein [Caulobacter sp. S6]
MTLARKALRTAPALLLALLAGACAVGPDYQRPDLKLTAAYHAAAPAAASAPVELETWWRAFGDPELVRVVERAQAQNLDIEQARARILQSRALARAAGAALLPQAAASGNAARTGQSLQSPIGEIGGHLPGFQRDFDEATLGVGASWEIDLFGGLRRQHEAALANAKASEARAAAVRLSVTADAADAYLQARAFQARLDVARRQEKTQADLVDLLNRRVGQGVSPEREQHQAQALLEQVRASIPPLVSGLEAELNRLDVLMDAQPGSWRAELEAPADLPAAPTLSIAEGPGELLRRRPDVLAAEQKLVAANAGIGAAIADYYPKVSISGLLGVDSMDAGSLFAGRALEHQIAGGLRWRLFDFGRIDAEVAEAEGAKAEALAAWRQSVLRATEEVEDAVTDLAQQQARAQALTRQIDQLKAARDQAEQAYEGGVISLTDVRDADRDLLSASDQLVQARAGAARAAVAAYRALGGGWRPEASLQVAANSGVRH